MRKIDPEFDLWELESEASVKKLIIYKLNNFFLGDFRTSL